MSKRGKHIYTIEPQKRVSMGDGGWMMCPDDFAERWAIIQLTVFRKGKRQYRTRRVLDHFGSRAKAQQVLANILSKQRPYKS